MKFIYSKCFIYLIFILSVITLFAFFSHAFNSSGGKLRNLIDDDLEEFCKENEDIYDYYYKSQEYKLTIEDFGEITKKSRIILDFIEDDFKIKYIFKYFGHCGKYIFFLILLILIIIVTIYYSFASCIRCCTEKCCNIFSFECCKNKCLKRTACILIPIIYLFVFILSFISIAFIIYAIRRLSGVVCVGLQLADSFIVGEIRDSNPKWAGAGIVSEILEKLADLTSVSDQNRVETINSNTNNYMESLINYVNSWNESYYKHLNEYFQLLSPKMTKDDVEKLYNITPEYSRNWKNILNNILEYDLDNDGKATKIVDIITSSLYGFLGCSYYDDVHIKCEADGLLSPLFRKGTDIIKELKEPISDIKEKIINTFRNIYDKVNSIVIAIFAVFIIFVIFYCLIIEILLIIFCCAEKCKCIGLCIKWILCFIYYTSIFIVIIGFALGIVVGCIGDLAQNFIPIIKYIISSENLLDPEPDFFGKNSITEYLDVCINGNGNLAEKLNLVDSLTKVDNMSEIADDTEEYINETNIETSPVIDYYLDYFNQLDKSYLNISYYQIENNSTFSIKDRIQEINKYVSGSYSTDSTCKINEVWDIIKEKEGYEYDSNYPPFNINKHYLLYLYDEILYANDNIFKNRYKDNTCPTTNSAYETIDKASEVFCKFFKDIRGNMLSDKFYKGYKDDLERLNTIFGNKTKYLQQALKLSIKPITDIKNVFSNYRSHIFELLNCKFVGNNANILLDILNSSLGLYLNGFGVTMCLVSLFIFIGIIFILIIIKNTKLDDKDVVANIDFESFNHILKGNNAENQAISKFENNNQIIPAE